MTKSTGSVLAQHWRSHVMTQLGPPAALRDIQAFEKQHSVTLPQELPEYYCTVNGFLPPNDQDENGFSFWPLSRVCRVSALEDGKWASEQTVDCYAFADYLSLSWAYAFRLTRDGIESPVYIVGTATGRPQSVASNFADFVDLYVRDDERLYPVSEPTP